MLPRRLSRMFLLDQGLTMTSMTLETVLVWQCNMSKAFRRNVGYVQEHQVFTVVSVMCASCQWGHACAYISLVVLWLSFEMQFRGQSLECNPAPQPRPGLIFRHASKLDHSKIPCIPMYTVCVSFTPCFVHQGHANTHKTSRLVIMLKAHHLAGLLF